MAIRSPRQPRAARSNSEPAPPLAAATERLRDVPGFPRRRGRPRRRPRDERSHAETSAVADAVVAPRLLDVKDAAAYLGVSPWTIRDLDAAGTLKRVRIAGRQSDLRKLLFDRADLDRLIEVSKI